MCMSVLSMLYLSVIMQRTIITPFETIRYKQKMVKIIARGDNHLQCNGKLLLPALCAEKINHFRGTNISFQARNWSVLIRLIGKVVVHKSRSDKPRSNRVYIVLYFLNIPPSSLLFTVLISNMYIIEYLRIDGVFNNILEEFKLLKPVV